MIASEKYHELAAILNKTSKEISSEDVQTAVTLLTQCTSNILNGINGPLQERTNVLELDLLLSNNDLLEEINSEKERNFYYQKQIANKITKQVNETISLLTLSLNNHLNFGQNYTINTSEVFMLLKSTSINFLSNQTIEQIANSQIKFPTNFSSNLNPNLSRSVASSILNQNGSELSIKTTENSSIELIIPRDLNIILPEMILQNVILSNQSFYYKFIHLKNLQINPNLTISIHFQIQPINPTLAYLFIYQFDNPIQLNQLDGWKIFCPVINETFYTYYIDNQRLSNHQSIIFGLRELTSTEFENVCLNNSTENFSIKNSNSNFTSNYYLRIYTSGCYYLDQYNNWQSDGLLVGPKTNLYQTQCFRNHL